MNEGKIPVRYAKAYIEFASEKKILDEAIKDMQFILDICKLPDFIDILSSPILLKSKKLKTLNDLFKGNVNKNTLLFFDLLLKHNRESYLPAIARMFIHEYKIRKKIKSAILTSVKGLNKSQKQKIINVVKHIFQSEIELKETIDENIIGGFVLTVEDQQFDASTASKLKNIKQELIDTTIE